MTIPPKTDLPTRTILLNASSLKFSHCQRNYNFKVCEGLQSTESHEALLFGKAVHRFAEHMLNGGDPGAGLQVACASYTGNDTARLAKACMAMPAHIVTPYRHEAKAYVEHKFKVYWRSVVYEGTQYDIYVCGTMDVVSMYADGAVEITDWKTSRKWKRQEIFADYRVSVQMRFYLWAAWRFAYDIFDITVANQTQRANVFLRIGAVLLSATPPVWVMGTPIMMAATELQAFEGLLSEHIAQVILPAWHNPQPTGMLNDTCNKCDFVNLCFAENDTAHEQARQQFKVVPYDPATF